MGVFPLTVETAVRRARARGQRLGIYVSTRFDAALAEAGARRGPLAGVPYGLKDAFDTPHLPTSGGSWRFRDRITPGRGSAPFRAFDAAGAVLLGKSNLSDMGLAPEATSYVGGATRNPFDPARTAGGSSGGSAASVAYGIHAFDWGSDIGGSIRLPAAFCGVLGLKLSSETWPLQELFPPVPPSMSWMCGQGPFARTPAQLRAVLRAAAPVLRTGPSVPFAPRAVALYAPEPYRWPTFAADVRPVVAEALGLPVRETDALAPPRELLRTFVGVWASHFFDLVQSDVQTGLLDGLGAVLSAVITRGTLGDRRFHPLTAELLLLFALGRATWAPKRARARAQAFSVRETFRQMWADGHVVVAPTVAHPPPKIRASNRTPGLLAYTCAGNMADATALSIPFGTFGGRPGEVLPRSLQLLGPPGSEDILIDLADRIIAVRDARDALRQPSLHPVEDGPGLV